MDDKVLKYTFEDTATVYAKLRAHNETGSDVERIFSKFADRVGGNTRVPAGVNLAWEMAVYDVAQLPGSSPTELHFIANIIFRSSMEAVIDDPDFLAALAAIRAELTGRPAD